MQKTAYEIDDVCFIRLGEHKRLYRGRVAALFTDPGTTGVFYIIKVDNFTWPTFEIRDSSLMGETADAIVPAAVDIFNPDIPDAPLKRQ